MALNIIQPKNYKTDSIDWQNSENIKIENFSLSIGGKLLYDQTNLIINKFKYGFVGNNGAGKSTLLKAIYDRKFIIPPKISIYYVAQEVLNSNISAVQAVMQADVENISYLKREQEIIANLENEDYKDKEDELLKELQEIGTKLNLVDIDSFESKARTILSGLGFTTEMQNRNVNNFSGGWQMRISLARGLFMKPDILLLDEPTNHLDLDAVIWLNNYLIKWDKGLVVISHDQDFINSVCNNIIHLDNLRLNYYNCYYDKFFKMLKLNKLKYQKEWDKYIKKIKNLKKKGKYNKKNDKQYRTIKLDNNTIVLQKPQKEYKVQFDFNEAYSINNYLVQVKDLSFSYNNSNLIFKNINFGINNQDRIVILGKNGIGKSTLFKIINKDVKPNNGIVNINNNCNIAYYNQHFINSLPMDKNPVEYLLDKYKEFNYQEIRNLLGKFGLKGKSQILNIKSLSGGQKARIVFVDIYLENANLILLDEPTNNLDIESVNALIKAINNYKGSIVIITHDIKLIEEIDCNIYICSDQNLYKYNGNINDYKDEILENIIDD